MQLSPDDIRELKEAHFKDYGVKLSDEEAAKLADSLLTFFQHISQAQPPP